MKSIYLILTRSCTVISRVIYRVTGENYTHAAVAFDDDLRKMYSFARKYPSFPLPAGFMEEHTDGKFYRSQGNIPCLVLRKKVSLREYYRLKGIIYKMQCRADEYKYSLLGLLLCKMRIPLDIPRHFFCSQFAAAILRDAGIITLPKPPSLMHPADFVGIRGFDCVFNGGFSDWNKICESEEICLTDILLTAKPA